MGHQRRPGIGRFRDARPGGGRASSRLLRRPSGTAIRPRFLRMPARRPGPGRDAGASPRRRRAPEWGRRTARAWPWCGRRGCRCLPGGSLGRRRTRPEGCCRGRRAVPAALACALEPQWPFLPPRSREHSVITKLQKRTAPRTGWFSGRPDCPGVVSRQFPWRRQSGRPVSRGCARAAAATCARRPGRPASALWTTGEANDPP
jgi:hypothetical protein